MRLRATQSWFFVMIASILVAGCDVVIQTASSPPSTVAPGLVETLVVQTISARDTQTAAAQPSSTATSTSTTVPLPTFQAPTSIFSTATTFVVVPPASGSGGGSSSSTAAYSCDPDIDKRPRDNTVFAPNDDFQVKWTLLNDGTKTWPAGLDLTYFSGPQMTSTTFVQLPEVKPGGTFSVVLAASAPASKGFYVMTWKLQGPVCYPYVAINVK